MPTINFDWVLEPALVGINRAYVFMGLGVNAARNPNLTEYRLGEAAYLQLVPDELPDSKIAEFKSAFADWVIAGGLRELIETWDVFLDRFYEALLHAEAWTISRQSGQVDKNTHDRRLRGFVKRGTRYKLAALRDEFGVALAFDREIESLKKVRDCLAHRLGIVAKKDAGSDPELVVSWRTPELYGFYPDGSEFVPRLDNLPIEFPEGSPVRVRPGPRTKSVPIGSHIGFDVQELKEICLTFRLALDEARVGFVKYVEGVGGTINEPSKDAANRGPAA